MEVLFGILIAVIALIAYGSLYPWQFVARELPASPLYILLHSWKTSEDRRFVADVAINLAIYMPLGMSAFLALRRFGSRVLEMAVPVVLGTVLSGSIEMIQLYTPRRICSAVDLVDNIIGSALGVAAGIVFVRLVNVPLSLHGHLRVRDRSAVALLFCWISYLLFPVFPDLSLYVWRSKVLEFLHMPPVSAVPMLLAAAEWLAAGRLLIAAGARAPVRWMAIALVLAPVQFTLMNRMPTPSEFIGAAVGVGVFWLFRVRPGADRVAAAALLFAVVMRGITPFHFAAESLGFQWVPFVAMLNTEWQAGIQILLRKMFEYGAAVWLLQRAGMRLVYATCLVAAILGGIEAVQIRIPQHVAEITDPLLAVLMGLAFGVLSRREVERAKTLPAAILRRT